MHGLRGPATTEIWFTYSGRFVHPESSPLVTAKDPLSWVDGGNYLMLLGYYFIYPFIWAFSWLTSRRFRGLSPRCDQHRRRHGTLQLVEKNAQRVVIEGAHEAFIHAFRHPQSVSP